MDVAVVGAVVGALVNNIVAKLVTVVAKRSSELGALRGDITCLKTELELIATTTDAVQKGQAISDVQQIAMAAMRDLAFEVEDCLDQFLPCAACGGGAAANGNLVDFALQVTNLKRRLKEAHEQIDDANARQQAPSVVDGHSVSVQATVLPSELVEPSDMVGIEEPKKEILGLLDGEKLMVISIVGFGGSGKTALARAVFDEAKQKFDLPAWYEASKHKDGNDLLVAIVNGLHPDGITLSTAQIQSQNSWLQNSIQKRLRKKMCLIVIDDVEEKHHWGAIHKFVSKLPNIRILLTTSVQTVAKACTRDGDYIYNMRTLSARDSEDLLKKRVGDFNRSSTDLDAIVRKCHGHPLALISVANYLLRKEITGEVWHNTSRLLCTHVDEDRHGDFTKLRQVLVDNYISLPVHLKTCLLYISLFPNDRPVSMKTLTSRWLAEGYIKPEGQRTEQETADDKLEQLMDRNIISPIDTSYRGGKKTFKPHGIMHQFMLYKSISSKFIAPSLQDRGNYRHIIMEDRTNGRASEMDHGTSPAARRPNFLKKLLCTCFSPSTSTGSDEQLRPRSLTVFGSAENDFYSDLISCKLLRVLDLKECNNLVEEHIKKIYKLLHLKYLTLGSSVSGLSDKMKNLHCLETLDLRKTKIKTLPVEVISLPHLVHLFGMIKLSKLSSKKISKFLSRECNLETLSGVVIERKSRFPELMAHMKQLKKLKIWCRTTSRDRNFTKLLDAICKFSKADTSTPQGDRFISLHLHESSKDLLHHLQGANPDVLFYLSSLKLHGRPTGFHEFATFLSGLKELCLTYTNLKGDDLLAGLRKLKCLVYLKLVEVKLEDLVIDVVGDLASLKRLCLVVQQSKFPQITEGALPRLVSLQLLCKDLEGLCDGINLEYFKYLREVALDSRVNQAGTIEVWEKEAKKHPRMPKVVLLKRVEPAHPVKYVATDHGSLESLAQETS